MICANTTRTQEKGRLQLPCQPQFEQPQDREQPVFNGVVGAALPALWLFLWGFYEHSRD